MRLLSKQIIHRGIELPHLSSRRRQLLQRAREVFLARNKMRRLLLDEAHARLELAVLVEGAADEAQACGLGRLGRLGRFGRR